MKYFIIILFFLTACSVDKKETLDLDVIKIKVTPTDSSTKFLEDISDTIHHLKLNSQKGFAIKHMSKLFLTDSLIIVADRAQSVVLVFDSKGEPKNKIMHWGGGAGEYTNMTDVVYDPKSHQIEILDLSIEKILIYNIAGKFVKSMDIVGARNFGLTFAKINETYATQMLNNTNNKHMNRLGVFKEENNTLVNQKQELLYFPIIQNLDLAYWHQFENYKDSLFYFPMMDDKIYQISLNEAKPIYKIELPTRNQIGFAIKTLKPAKDHFEYWKKMESSETMYDNQSLFITDKCVSFRYFFQSNRSPRDVVYSKKTGKVLQFSTLRSKSDKNFRSQTGIIATADDYFVTLAPFSDEQINLIEKAKGNIDVQPTLIFFRLKDF